jgi:hypothetical protein
LIKEKIMKQLFVAMFALMFALPVVSHADEDFYGKIESRPDAGTGQWVIGGRNVDVTARTHLDDRKGPLEVGACVEVEIDDGIVEEIETERMRKCDRRR